MTVQMLYAVAISSIVKVTPRAPSSVQPHGIRMIELVASSSPWLPSSTFLCLGPFLWRCKVSTLLPPMLSLIVCVHVYCCFNFFVMQMLLMNILCSKKLQKKSVFLVAKISEFCSGLAARHVFYFSSVCHFSLVRRSIMYVSSVQYENIRESTDIIMSHKCKYRYRSFSP